MGHTQMIPPEQWWPMTSLLWVRVEPLDDPLLRAKEHRVDVHDDGQGHMWLVVEGANAGVRMQSARPDDHDFAQTNGEPL